MSQFFYGLLLIMALTSCKTPETVVQSESKLNYTYTTLKLFEIDKMTELIQEKLRAYKRTKNQDLITEALQIVLSRPNEDGMVEKLLDTIRFRLETNEEWERLLALEVDLALAELKSGTAAQQDQVSYLILLNNLVFEFRPEFVKQYKSPGFETAIVEKIAAAGVTVSRLARKECDMNVMTVPKSPSDLAQILINEKNARLNPPKP